MQVLFDTFKAELSSMAKLNRLCLHILLYLLYLIAGQANTNHMDAANLAVVFFPLLFNAITRINPFLQALVRVLVEQTKDIFPAPRVNEGSGL